MLIWVSRVKIWRKAGGQDISIFFPPVSSVGAGELLITVKLHKYLGLGDDPLMIP